MTTINELGIPRDPIVLANTRISIEGVQGAARERARFWNMLVTFVPGSGYVSSQDRRVTVLDVACSTADEAPFLNRYFGGGSFDGDARRAIRVIGIDKRAEKIREAKELVEFDGGDYTFIVGDASNLQKYGEIPEEVDVVFLRNPHIRSNSSVWTEIFRQGLGRLSAGGVLISTLFSEEEHRQVVDLVKSLGGTVVVNVHNPESGRDIMPNESSDRHILIAKRLSATPLVVNSGK